MKESQSGKIFGIENYGDIKNVTLTHHINQALRANYLYRKDIDYGAGRKSGDCREFTGRILKGRVYSDGLHQQKPKAWKSVRTKTLASITYQNLSMYRKIGNDRNRKDGGRRIPQPLQHGGQSRPHKQACHPD